MGAVGSAWLAYVAAATFRELKKAPGLPRPNVYIGASVVYSMLALVAQSQSARTFAATLGWAFVIAEIVKGDFIPTPGGYQIPLNSPQAVGAIELTTAGNRTTTANNGYPYGIAGAGGANPGKTSRGARP